VSANLGDRTTAWLATHWLLRESAVCRDRNTPEVRAAQRDAEYTYRLAVGSARRGHYADLYGIQAAAYR